MIGCNIQDEEIMAAKAKLEEFVVLANPQTCAEIAKILGTWTWLTNEISSVYDIVASSHDFLHSGGLIWTETHRVIFQRMKQRIQI